MGESRSSALASTRVASRDPPRGMEPVLGRYQLCRRLGAGGFGTVWLAWDERLEREVALKLLPRELIASGRFEREARAAARLNHPGIVLLYEAAVDDEGGYLVSELVRGHTLDDLLRDGALSDRDIVSAALCLCDALEYAHGHGVVHRDVKPSNILLPEAPSTPAATAKLNDFGVARLIGSESLTRTGDVVGTTAYMAPEQAEGREADSSADLYSLALVSYEALTGVNPIRAAGMSARGGRRLGTYLPAVRRYRRDLPRELACGIDLALRPRQRERGTVQDLREALRSALPRVDSEPGVLAGYRSEPTRHLPAARRVTSPASAPVRRQEPRVVPDWPGSGSPAVDHGRFRPGWRARLLVAGAAATFTAWFSASVLSPAPVLPVLAGVAAALAGVLLPALSWLVLVIVAAGLLIYQGGPGGAIVLLMATLPVCLALLRHPTRWVLAASAPALAAVGLGGLWPALAGRASTAQERLVLGAGGWLWLVVGGFLAGHSGYLRLPLSTRSPRLWMASLHETAHQVLSPLLSSGILAPALVWGIGALILPWISPRQVTPGRVGPWFGRGILILTWAVGLTLATQGLLGALDPAVRLPTGQIVLGTLSCAVAAGLRLPVTPRRQAGHAQTAAWDSRSMETR